MCSGYCCVTSHAACLTCDFHRILGGVRVGDLCDFKHCKSRKERIKMFLLIVVAALEWQIVWNKSCGWESTVGNCWSDLGARV